MLYQRRMREAQRGNLKVAYWRRIPYDRRATITDLKEHFKAHGRAYTRSEIERVYNIARKVVPFCHYPMRLPGWPGLYFFCRNMVDDDCYYCAYHLIATNRDDPYLLSLLR